MHKFAVISLLLERLLIKLCTWYVAGKEIKAYAVSSMLLQYKNKSHLQFLVENSTKMNIASSPELLLLQHYP